MIQRIQSIYLFVGALIVGSFVFTEWSVTMDSTWSWLMPTTRILAVVTAIIGIGAIFLYNNRSQQRKMVVWVQLLAVLFLLLVFLLVLLGDQLPKLYSDGLNIWMLLSLAGPVVAYALFFLARRSIDKDIALIRSMDRIR